MAQQIYSEVEEIQEAYRIYNDALADTETRLNALSREKFLRNQLSYKVEGYEKGLAEGEAKGKAEGKAEIARNLKRKGFSPTEISELTGFSHQELEKL